MPDLSYTIDPKGRLFVFAPKTEEFLFEYNGSKWTVYNGLLRAWLESEPITEEAAMKITAGVKLTLK